MIKIVVHSLGRLAGTDVALSAFDSFCRNALDKEAAATSLADFLGQ